MLLSPWTQTKDEDSLEEQKIPMPCLCSGPMYYLNKSYEEVLDDYTMLHEMQAAPDLYA